MFAVRCDGLVAEVADWTARLEEVPWRFTPSKSWALVFAYLRGLLAHAYLSATRATAGAGSGAGSEQFIALTVPKLRRLLNTHIRTSDLTSTTSRTCRGGATVAKPRPAPLPPGLRTATAMRTVAALSRPGASTTGVGGRPASARTGSACRASLAISETEQRVAGQECDGSLVGDFKGAAEADQ